MRGLFLFPAFIFRRRPGEVKILLRRKKGLRLEIEGFLFCCCFTFSSDTRSCLEMLQLCTSNWGDRPLPHPQHWPRASWGWRENSCSMLDKNKDLTNFHLFSFVGPEYLKLCNRFNLKCPWRKEAPIIPFTHLAWKPEPYAQDQLCVCVWTSLHPNVKLTPYLLHSPFSLYTAPRTCTVNPAMF